MGIRACLNVYDVTSRQALAQSRLTAARGSGFGTSRWPQLPVSTPSGGDSDALSGIGEAWTFQRHERDSSWSASVHCGRSEWRTAAPLRRTAVRRSPSHRGDWRLALILILPATAGFCVFAAYPTIRGIYLSFTNFRILSPPTWAGLTNYRHLFSDDVFWNSLRVTVYFVALTVGVGLAVSLTSAVILHRLTQSTVIRGLVLLPFLISGVVAALVWQWMLDPGLGIINVVVKAVIGHNFFFSDRRTGLSHRYRSSASEVDGLQRHPDFCGSADDSR